MRRSLLYFASTAGLLCLAASQARADLSTTDVQWSYNFTPQSSFVSADAPGTGTVSITNEPTKSATNSSDVVVTNLRVSSTASGISPDTIGSGAYKIAFTLTDQASGNSSPTMWIAGNLGGSFSSANSNVSNAFTGQTTFSWVDPKNGDTFTATLTGYTPPGPPTASNAGSISAHVTVTPGNGSGTTSSTPEPSTMVMSLLGLSFAGLTSWRKRRRTMAEVLA